MDEDTKWLYETCNQAVPPQVAVTIWRGITPLTDWWLLIFTGDAWDRRAIVRHEAVHDRDTASIRIVLKNSGIPLRPDTPS